MNYCGIIKDDIANGNGVRISLFISGCSLNCSPACQNKEAQNPNYGKPFDDNTKQEIFDELSKAYISGLSISGGHPLESYNLPEVTALCKEVKTKFQNKTIWVWTGYVYESIKDLEIMQYIDVLVDGPYVDSQRDITLKWRGSRNQRVIDIPKTREQNQAVLYCD